MIVKILVIAVFVYVIACIIFVLGCGGDIGQ